MPSYKMHKYLLKLIICTSACLCFGHCVQVIVFWSLCLGHCVWVTLSQLICTVSLITASSMELFLYFSHFVLTFSCFQNLLLGCWVIKMEVWLPSPFKMSNLPHFLKLVPVGWCLFNCACSSQLIWKFLVKIMTIFLK